MKNVVICLCIFVCVAAVSLPADSEVGKWAYREVVTNPGTRSEGRVGYLHYGDESMQGYFSEIVVETRRYVWYVRVEPWDSAGYIPDGTETPDPAVHEPSLTPAIIERGWYPASYGERRRGTPDSWVWVRHKELAGYIDPSRVVLIAGQLGIEQAQLDGLHLEHRRPQDH